MPGCGGRQPPALLPDFPGSQPARSFGEACVVYDFETPAFPPTTTPAAFSIGWIAEVKSDSAPISRITTSHSRPTASATSIDSPSDLASSRQSRTSFTISPVAQQKSQGGAG